VTDRSWDPLINAPAVHGDPNVDFIGEYFGLDAGEEDLALLWTDTRTGVQELFSDVVRTKKDLLSPHPRAGQRDPLRCDPRWGGVIIVGGKVVRVPPRSPEFEALERLADLGTEVDEVERAAVAESIVREVIDDLGSEGTD